MAEDYLEYDGQLVDDEPIAVVLYASTWRKYLLGLALALREREFWKPNASVDDAVAQADAFTTLLLGEPMAVLPGFPHHTSFLGGEAVILHGVKTPVFAPDSSQAFGVFWHQDTADNNDDWVWTANLAAGDYHLTLIGVKSATSGKTEVYIDGVKIDPSLQDWYAAVTTYNQTQVLEFTLTEKGFHSVMVKVNGKNPSSEDYYLGLSAVVIRYR